MPDSISTVKNGASGSWPFGNVLTLPPDHVTFTSASYTPGVFVFPVIPVNHDAVPIPGFVSWSGSAVPVR